MEELKGIKGLYNKYIVIKSDTTPIDTNADYFVLRLDTDKYAREALKFYGSAIYQDNPELAHDIFKRLNYYWEKEKSMKNKI